MKTVRQATTVYNNSMVHFRLTYINIRMVVEYGILPCWKVLKLAPGWAESGGLLTNIGSQPERVPRKWGSWAQHG